VKDYLRVTWKDPKKALGREEQRDSKSDPWMVMMMDSMMEKLRVLSLGRKLEQPKVLLMEKPSDSAMVDKLDLQKVN